MKSAFASSDLRSGKCREISYFVYKARTERIVRETTSTRSTWPTETWVNLKWRCTWNIARLLLKMFVCVFICMFHYFI